MGPQFGTHTGTEVFEMTPQMQNTLGANLLAQMPGYVGNGEWKKHPMYCGTKTGVPLFSRSVCR